MIGTFGCSFTYGEELENLSNAWPYLLGTKLGQPVSNYGIMGASNERIVREVMQRIAEQPLDKVIVAWTDSNRKEFFAKTPIVARRYKNYTGPLCVNPGWATGINFIKEYYTNWHDDFHSLLKWLQQVVLLQSYLESKQIDYYFCNAFGNQELLTKNRSNTELTYWMNQIITDRFIGWPSQGFVEWAYGEKIGPGGHPLEEGHKKIAEKIYEHIRNK